MFVIKQCTVVRFFRFSHFSFLAYNFFFELLPLRWFVCFLTDLQLDLVFLFSLYLTIFLYFTLLFFFPSYSFRLFLVSFVSPWHLTNPGTNFQPLVALFLLLISLFTSTSLLPWLTAGQNYYRRGQLKPTYFICGRQPIYNRKRKLADSHSTRTLCNHQCWT